MLFKITQKQVGNGIGTILASIGIPVLLNAIMPKRGWGWGKQRGKGGLRVGSMRGGAGLQIGTPFNPPPFIGNRITGRGKKKKKKRMEEKVYY